jgi:hypothetical protein
MGAGTTHVVIPDLIGDFAFLVREANMCKSSL